LCEKKAREKIRWKKFLNERIASEVETDYKDGSGGGAETLLSAINGLFFLFLFLAVNAEKINGRD
jgi:hypothetical protein